jgi:hypothetical protein
MSKEKVFEILKIRGPMLPLEIGKLTGLDSIMAGAYLSELVSNKRARLSYLKVGGSPLYYVDGQEHKLQNYKDSLKGPEKKAFEILKEAKLLKDADLEPVIRVSFQNMKDFAKPIEITQNSHKELYWKWYLVKNDQLRDILAPVQKPAEPEPQPEKEEPKEEVKEETKPEAVKEPEPVRQHETSEQKEEPVPEKEEKHKEPDSEPEPKPEPKKETESKKEESKSEAVKEPEPKPEISKEISEPSSDFEKTVQDFLEKNNIGIISKKVIRADSEIEYQLLIPSAVGKILYFAVAKSKKRCSDADLSQLFVAASVAKLPGLFIHTGELAKKAKEKLKTDFKIITTYKI